MEEECDALLINLAQRVGGIQPLLHSFFSFLKRKTDFYHIQKPGDRIGFPPGKAKELVLEAYFRFASHDHGLPPSQKDLESRGERLVPHEKQEHETSGSKPSDKAFPSPSKVLNDAKPSPGTAAAVSNAGAAGPSQSQQDLAKRQEQAGGVGAAGGTEGKGDTDAVESGRGNFVTYNGGDGNGYKWSQTIDEVVIFVDCSPHSTKVKGKDVRCHVSKSSLRVALQLHGAPAPTELLQGVWHVEDSRFVSVTMEKRKKIWWKSALAGDAEIDTQKVDSTCSIDDYDQPTQAAIEKLMFDQHQKMQGKPTSDELQQHDMLRKAWDAEGSPFKGTPFDPSAINFSGQQPPLP